jgi:hypothetical protein
MFADTEQYVANVLRIQKRLQQGWNTRLPRVSVTQRAR